MTERVCGKAEKIMQLLNAPGGNVALGVDGYVDEVWQIVESRSSREAYRVFEKITDFSRAFAKCDEGGFSNEIVRKRRSYGGFTANTSKSLIRLDVAPAIIGMFGQREIEPVFAEFAETKKLVPVGDPGITQIYEFSDGKLMLTYIQEVMGLNWDSLTEAAGEEKLREIFSEADIIALGYWSLVPAFDEIVENICELTRGDSKKKRMFFDFADIRKRDRASLESTLGRLAALNGRFPMTLSLNEHETALLFAYKGEDFKQEIEGADLQTERVRKAIGLDELIVHTPHFAVLASASDEPCSIPQHYCTSPSITAGAGDNFNGGYLTAMLKGLNIAERLMVANAATYQFLSLGYSPDKAELFEELKEAERRLLENGYFGACAESEYNIVCRRSQV